jgi:cysteine synthase
LCDLYAGYAGEGNLGEKGDLGLALTDRKTFALELIIFRSQSQEKIDLLRMLGADVRPVPGESRFVSYPSVL